MPLRKTIEACFDIGDFTGHYLLLCCVIVHGDDIMCGIRMISVLLKRKDMLIPLQVKSAAALNIFVAFFSLAVTEKRLMLAVKWLMSESTS